MGLDAAPGTGAAATPPRATEAGRTGRRALASLRLHPAVAVVVGACAVLFRQAMRSALAGDVYFHLAAGNWMLAHHAVIRTDVFSYTVRGTPWTADEWGFEYALAWLVRDVGDVSFWLVSAGCCTAAVVLGVATWRRNGAGWLWTAVLSCLATAGLLVGLAVRPQDPSYMLFAAELLLLALARRRALWLAAFPPLLLVWANVHGSYLLGLSLLALEVVWSVLPTTGGRLAVSTRLPTRAVAAALVASFAATLVNPHGLALLAYDLHVSTSSELTSLVSEWQSPNFHDLFVLALVVAPLIYLLGTLGLSDRRVALEDVVVACGLLLATFHAVRFLPYLVLAWCAVLSRASPLRRETIRPSLATVPLAAVLAGALLAGHHLPAGSPLRGRSSWATPVQAAAYLAHRPGRVFATYWWGDYLTYVGIPVFVDGRTDLYLGSGVLSTYSEVSGLSTGPDTVFRRFDVRYVLWSRESALATYLSHDPRWRLVLDSGPALVYEHLGTW